MWTKIQQKEFDETKKLCHEKIIFKFDDLMKAQLLTSDANK